MKINVGQTTVHEESTSKFVDFEDGVQIFCVTEAKHKIIVTRNTKNFKQSSIFIMTPKEFLVKLQSLT